MAHQLLHLKHQSHDTLSITLVGGGLSALVVIGYVLVMHWRGRHAVLPPAWPAKNARRRATRASRR